MQVLQLCQKAGLVKLGHIAIRAATVMPFAPGEAGELASNTPMVPLAGETVGVSSDVVADVIRKAVAQLHPPPVPAATSAPVPTPAPVAAPAPPSSFAPRLEPAPGSFAGTMYGGELAAAVKAALPFDEVAGASDGVREDAGQPLASSPAPLAAAPPAARRPARGRAFEATSGLDDSGLLAAQIRAAIANPFSRAAPPVSTSDLHPAPTPSSHRRVVPAPLDPSHDELGNLGSAFLAALERLADEPHGPAT